MESAPSRDPGAGETTIQQRFFRYFQHEATALQEQMDRLADRALIAGERSDAADHCLAGITRLSSEVKDASTYLPAYDQRAYADAIKALQDKFQETRATFAPKPKFSFKSARKSPSAISLSDAAELAAQKRRGALENLSPNFQTPNTSASATPGYLQTPPNEKAIGNRPVPVSPPPTAREHEATAQTPEADAEADEAASRPIRPRFSTTSTSISISNQSNAHIILPASSLRTQTPCSLSKLDGCCLDLSMPSTSTGPFASLTVNFVSSSLLLCGQVAGPAHITGVRNSVIVIHCRQFRMHECHNVDVYIYCSSRPIIEDSKGVRFADLPKAYQELLTPSQSSQHLPSSSDPASTSTSIPTSNPTSLPSPSTSDPTFSSTSQTQTQTQTQAQIQRQPSSTPTPPNLYAQIQDFNHLKSTASPNFTLLPPQDTVPDEVWRDVVPGGPGWALSDILRGVGISVSPGGISAAGGGGGSGGINPAAGV